MFTRVFRDYISKNPDHNLNELDIKFNHNGNFKVKVLQLGIIKFQVTHTSKVQLFVINLVSKNLLKYFYMFQ